MAFWVAPAGFLAVCVCLPFVILHACRGVYGAEHFPALDFWMPEVSAEVFAMAEITDQDIISARLYQDAPIDFQQRFPAITLALRHNRLATVGTDITRIVL